MYERPVLLALLAMLLALAGLLVISILFIRQRRMLKSISKEDLPLNLGKLDLLYTLVDSMPDWIYIKDRESRFILANKHMASYHGIESPEEMTGKTDFDYYPGEIARGFHNDEQMIMDSGESIINKEEVVRDSKGNELILSTTKIPVKNKSGETVGIVGIGRDITRQKKDQVRLRELSMVASGTGHVVVIMDADGNFKWVNRGFEIRYGATLDEFVKKRGRNLRENSSQELIDEILVEVIRTGKPYTYTTRTMDLDSKDAWYQTIITPILNDRGAVTSMFLIDSDITALKKADLQIKQQKYELESQRDQLKNLNASKDRLFSIIAHDLKNPFQAIIGFAELLKDQYNTLDQPEVNEYLACIYNSSTSAYDLLYNLLEWARAQTRSIRIRPQQLLVRKEVGEIMDLLCAQAKNKEIALVNDVEPDTAVLADVNMLHTILRNLIANAIKYTFEGGKITLSATRKEKHVEIHVNDTGLGMTEDKIKTLFSIDKAESTPGTSGENGTGLGLLVCYEFLEMNNGFMKVQSEPGEGSTFTVTLPAE
ncbi:MAG: PAS domain-containing protein [Bacteroidota bacterium]